MGSSSGRFVAQSLLTMTSAFLLPQGRKLLIATRSSRAIFESMSR